MLNISKIISDKSKKVEKIYSKIDKHENSFFIKNMQKSVKSVKNEQKNILDSGFIMENSEMNAFDQIKQKKEETTKKAKKIIDFMHNVSGKK